LWTGLGGLWYSFYLISSRLGNQAAETRRGEMPGDKTKVSCAACGTTNFFPIAAIGKKVVCGRCKTQLPVPGTVLEPSTVQASTLFQVSGLPVLVDFFSPTCGPCQMMHPVVERLAKRRAGDLMVVRISVESHPELAQRFGIHAVPTFIIIFKGLERARISGAVGEEDFAFWVASQT
jgi:thioredoxin 2